MFYGMRISQDQNSFVYCCNNCTNQLLASPSACRYHCIFCDDFDLCLKCFQSSRHQHILEKMDFNSPDESHSSDNNDPRSYSSFEAGTPDGIQRYLDAFVHALRCRAIDCNLGLCRKIKRMFAHGRACQGRRSGSCTVCQHMSRLLYLHRQRCQESQCPAPLCSVIKERVRRQRLVLRIRTLMANRPPAFRNAFRAATASRSASVPGSSASGSTTSHTATSPRNRLASLRTTSAAHRVALATLRTASFDLPLLETPVREMPAVSTISTVPVETAPSTSSAPMNSTNTGPGLLTINQPVASTSTAGINTLQSVSAMSVTESPPSPVASTSRASIVNTSSTYLHTITPTISKNPPASQNVSENLLLQKSSCPDISTRQQSLPQSNLGIGRGKPVIARCKMMYEADDSGEETERIEMSSDSEPEDMPLHELKGRTRK